MAQKKPKAPDDNVNVEPGADKRLANILKRALNTPPQHRSAAASNAERKSAKSRKT